MIPRRRFLFIAPALVACASVYAQSPFAFTVSMPQPTAHFFHVTMRCDGLKGELQDFKLPAWSPGYCRILDCAKNVQNFRAEDATGRPLPWQQTAKNTWRVAAGSAPVSGRPQHVVLENVAPTVDRTKMLADLKRIVEAATNLIGDRISRTGKTPDVEVTLAKNFKRNYTLQVQPEASAFQAGILKNWLRNENGRPE